MNLSFESGAFPDRLKIARIALIFKGGTNLTEKTTGQFPFSPVVSKIHEQFANEQLQSYARENGLITKEQLHIRRTLQPLPRYLSGRRMEMGKG